MSYVSEYAVPLLAGAAIYGIFAMAIAGLGIAACVRARRHKDPARVGFSWLKALLTLSFL